METTSSVSPKAVPQLADCKDVLADVGIQALMSDLVLQTSILLSNLKGLEIALRNNVKKVLFKQRDSRRRKQVAYQVQKLILSCDMWPGKKVHILAGFQFG